MRLQPETFCSSQSLSKTSVEKTSALQLSSSQAFQEGAGLFHLPAPGRADPQGFACAGSFLQGVEGEERGRGEEGTNFACDAPAAAERSQALPKELRSSPTAVTFAMH